jgi:hypothetical protein
MRKLYTLLLATVLIFVFTVPVFALENIFGGYWRTRAYYQTDYSGTDNGDQDVRLVDTRTRLFYTAKFSDNFKFVNKFEFNTTWGDTNGGDFGADGMGNFRVKNSYVDFTLGNVNTKLGMQPITISRGFFFDDDFAGAVVTYNASKDVAIPFVWMKAYEGNSDGYGSEHLNKDVDFYAIYPQIKLNDKTTVAPLLAYAYSSNAQDWADFGGDYKETKVYYLGADVDLTAGPASIWFTGIYQGGDVESISLNDRLDVSAYLLAVGFSTDVQAVTIHGQTFYISGDDDATDKDINTYFVPAADGDGWNYDWAPILGGNGIFDNQSSAGSPGLTPTNIWALNLGASIKPMPKLSLTGDVWYATLNEDNANGDNYLGTELDLLATYSIFDNMSVDVLASYLFAGDATTDGTKNTEDPMMIGTRLSLSF